MSLYEEQNCTTLRIGYQVAATVKNVVSICVLQCFLDIGLSANERKIVRAKLSQFQITVRNSLKLGSNSDTISLWKTYRNRVKISGISELYFDLILRRFWEGFLGYLGTFSILAKNSCGWTPQKWHSPRASSEVFKAISKFLEDIDS